MTDRAAEHPEKEVPGQPVSAPSPEPAEPGAEEWATRYKYLLADFENFRRRVEREREGVSRQVRAGMLRELLPLFEAFRAAREALAHLPTGDPVRKGLELLDREWSTFFKHEGVAPVTEAGRLFHADEAEAVAEAPADTTHPAGTVVEVVQQGYRFFGGLLRPAKVVVARAPPPPNVPVPIPAETRDIEES